ncbi:MAG: hypothetical protein QM308_03010 [Bacillota bacterium]|nr:hypothetical protein [Bacillota bacterium]
MKRTLAAMLSALMLMTLLPLTSPPARAELDFDIGCTASSAYVGETFGWHVSNVSGGSGRYEFTFTVIKDGFAYAPELSRGGTPWRDFTPPAPGKYSVEVLVYDRTNDESAWAEGGEITVSPNPNKIIKVEPLSATSLKVTWNKVPGASEYFLWRSTDMKNWDLIIYIYNGTSFTNTGLKAGTRYFYKVGYDRTGGGDGIIFTSWLSPAVAGVPMGNTRITSINSPSKGRVRLAWAKAAGATGYQVAMAGSRNGNYKTVRQLNGTAAIFSGVKSGSSLYFKVRPYRRVYTTTYWGQYSAPRAIKVK